MENCGKERLIYLYKILNEISDENHPLSTTQLIEMLEKDYNIPSHRTTIATDVEILKKFGADICKINSKQNQYFIASRKFEIPELKLLIDAVESSKFITQKKSDDLVRKLASMASVYQSEKLKRNLSAPNRVKPGNEQIYYIVDTINDAINSFKKISFQYYEYDSRKQKTLKHNGYTYIFSPYTLIWNRDSYYALGYSDKHQKIVAFRVDRIAGVPQILDEKIIPKPKDFNVAKYTKSIFSMYSGEIVQTKLKCENSLMKVIIDHFGEDVVIEKYDDNSFLTTADVFVSPTFFGWIFGFCGKIQIESPKELKEQYKKLVDYTAESLD